MSFDPEPDVARLYKDVARDKDWIYCLMEYKVSGARWHSLLFMRYTLNVVRVSFVPTDLSVRQWTHLLPYLIDDPYEEDSYGWENIMAMDKDTSLYNADTHGEFGDFSLRSVILDLEAPPFIFSSFPP